jgi:branched-subunit amino acid aminotransferase/4-amino-4-deoxychorismate lyase
VEEQVLYKADILQADSLFICNSVRGVVPARLRKLKSC